MTNNLFVIYNMFVSAQNFIMHDASKYCIDNDPNELEKICYNVCFTNNTLTYDNICETCMSMYYNDHKIEIEHEITNGNKNTMNYVGWFNEMQKNYDEMKKYYLMAIKKGNPNAMINLGLYYEETANDYDEMKKYYNMAIYGFYSEDKNQNCQFDVEPERGDRYGICSCNKTDNVTSNVELKYDNRFNICESCEIRYGSILAMQHLANYYQDTEKNYDLMKKYHLMAIKIGGYDSMNSLGYYYRHIEKNYDLMKKYYNMAIDKNYLLTYYNFGHYYQYTEKNYDLMKKYYTKAIQSGDVDAMIQIGQYYDEIENNIQLAQKYYLMALNKNKYPVLIKKFDIIKLYFTSNNKNFIKNNASGEQKNRLAYFLDNAVDEICQSCFLENLCCVKNNVYLCGLCY